MEDEEIFDLEFEGADQSSSSSSQESEESEAEPSSSSSNSMTLGQSTIANWTENRDNFVTIHIMIQMELCSGDTLKDFLERWAEMKQGIDRKKNFDIFSQLLHGIRHVHD